MEKNWGDLTTHSSFLSGEREPDVHFFFFFSFFKGKKSDVFIMFGQFL